MKINKYDPAFPTDDYFDEKITNTLPGLTKREYFASLALQGILSAGDAESDPDLGNYYSVQWDWRERSTPEEIEQLQAIADFLQSDPLLVDPVATRGMVGTDGLSAAEITQLIQSSAVQQLLP